MSDSEYTIPEAIADVREALEQPIEALLLLTFGPELCAIIYCGEAEDVVKILAFSILKDAHVKYIVTAALKVASDTRKAAMLKSMPPNSHN